MENNNSSTTMRELGFDWPMFTGQNPTDFFTPAPSSSTVAQQPPPPPAMNTFTSMRSVNNNNNLGFDSQHYLNSFQETPFVDRNLDIDFSRLSISRNNPLLDSYMNNVYPTNRRVMPAPVNRTNNNGCHDANNKRYKFPGSLKDVRGKVYSVAKNQEGCQFLQMKCEEGNSEDIEMIFNEIKDHMRELMVDASMNYLAQKMFKVCSEEQMTQIVVSLISDDGNLTNICLNSHGTRAMQKLIELVRMAEQRSLIVSALRRITVTLTKNTNGHHVIQQCLKSFQVDEVQPILNVVSDNCLDIATDKSGCCVLQQCVLHATGASKERLMTEIIENSLHLAEHPYGNYVVQHLLGMQIPEVTGNILRKLDGNIVPLASNKYGSNVIEKILKDVPDDQSTPIIREILNSSQFLDVIQNPYGNYVVQSALQAAKGPIKEIMINRIQKDYPYLHSHPHGKRVLALARNSKPRGSTHA
uniref:pumilio homolog 12-like n=1 Tax=Erigeron canadensis TaxID=72917 RepID=UPI001CB9994A|nr:pumilio homolog 12-like [Erigeron canadensis]